MVKKRDDEEENKDLTRIEDLSEFLHQSDSDLDSKFDSFESPAIKDDLSSTGISLDSLDDSLESSSFDLPPDVPADIPPEIPFETSEETSFDFALETPEETLEESSEEPSESSFSFDTNEDTDHAFEENSTEYEPEAAYVAETEAEPETDPVAEVAFEERDDSAYVNHAEKFEDVKTFAQNFSYGKASVGGGNPPYSIIVRHIKYQQEADDILELLKEFGVVNEQNTSETEKALEIGSLIIPQISEYTAIVLAHKLRRFDLDLEVGLSDEVHPSKSGDQNPRGLLKKDNLKQNRSEGFKLADIQTPIQDIVVSTSSSLPGYLVESYIGVQTAFAIVEESELEKLQYVQKVQREHSEITDYDALDNSDLSSEKAFKDYQNSFALLYEDLAQQLKQKAFTQNANALLGLNFQLSPLQFERLHSRVNAYQITCSATLAIIRPENT